MSFPGSQSPLVSRKEWFSAGVSESPPKSEEIHRVGLSVKEWKQCGLEGRREVSGAGVMDCELRISQSNNWYTHKSCPAPHSEASTGTAGIWQGAKQPFGSSSFLLPRGQLEAGRMVRTAPFLS